jgi:predicted secreted protein
MRRHAVPAALARLVGSLLLLLGLVLPAAAADRALINMIGYSADGNHFAFEQFGIQDGSGFPFSSIFIIDLVNDEWVAGTPFEARIDDETASLADARAEAMGAAKAALDQYEIGVPVQILALNGEGEYAADTGMRLHWSTPACCGAGVTQADAQSLILSLRAIQSAEDYCQDMNPVGFILAYQDQNGVRELHADGDMLPKSRACTLDYRLYAVVEPFTEYYADGFTRRRVAIIATYPFGFEGVDRRFLAVPIDR